MEDVEELEQLIKELRISAAQTTKERARANAMFASIGDGAIATDSDAKIQQINPTALELLGLKKEEAIGQWFPKIIIATNDNGEVINPLDRPITRAILSGKPVSERTNYLTKSGKKLPVALTVSPIILDNRPIGAIEVFHDFTKEGEVDQMKSDFISLASHQLRTPLTAINTYTRLLAGAYAGELNKSQMEFINIILNSAERMNELINILLDISRIESGKIDILLKQANVNELINKVMKELEPQLKIKQHSIKLNTPSKPIEAVIDQALTTEMLTNLLTNAIKYSPPKSKIELTLAKHPKHILFTVHDRGYGIPKKDQARIFTKFFRADNAKEIETSGTGLGLYMVKKVSETLGGKVWFESSEDKGTTFFLSVPTDYVKAKVR